jgi:omega-hydroxy-beta-dihydromenaquinone-9 sulfotransferase
MAGLDLPLLGRLLRRRFKSWECYDFWEYYCRGFRRPFRDLQAQDVTEKVRQTLPAVLGQLLTTRRNRLLVKLTGWPRLGFLQAIFPDVCFVHIVRDGRAVANSLLNTDFWQGWSGPQQWRWGPLSQAQQEKWAYYDHSFVALAGIQWTLLLEATHLAAGAARPPAFLEVKYEELCADAPAVLRRVTTFCQLEWTSDFAAQVAVYPLSNRNHKWREELTAEQQRILEAVTQDCRQPYGYS